ncbi:GNAT family N-acetyltransferase [Granulicella sibirica]|nr:GNAT family N-acetyltransferase [Granulicella sibirica]
MLRLIFMSIPSIHVKVIVPEEIPAVAQLIGASVRGLQTGDYTEEQREAALATVFTVDSRLVQDGTYFGVVTDDGTLVGCGGWSARKTLYGGDHQVEEVSEDFLDPATDPAKIRAIFVHPDYARQGIGGLLLRVAEDAAAAEGFHRFEMASTLTGLQFYCQSGYRPLEQIRVPVADGQAIEVVRMRRRVG